MWRQKRRMRSVWVVVAGLLTVAPAAWAESSQEKFYKAYYLECARHDHGAAAALYDEVASDRRAPDELRHEARTRGGACHEEIACADFARLVPANTLAYCELSRPGDQLNKLLEMIGLLREDGSPDANSGDRFGISPALVSELVGLRGVALAVTGFDPARGEPSGVAIFHPGDIEVLRGLIETALPAATEQVEPIEGAPTYSIEGEALVTLTSRLVIVSQQRHEIESVILRLRGQEEESLATNADMAEIMASRGEGVLFFCVNFRPILPLINMGLAAASAEEPQMAAAMSLLDLNSLRSLVGRAGVNGDGIYLDLTLSLDEANRNLAFHFLRLPPINRDTLRRVPAGAAGFLAGAFNEPGKPIRPISGDSFDPEQPITFFDLGREVFANMTSAALFAIPADGARADGPPIPPVAAVLTVYDPARSMALWRQLLGVGSLASGGGSLSGSRVELSGVSATRFGFPENIDIYLANVDNDILISPSKEAIARSLATSNGGDSILDDPAYAASLERLGPAATLAFFAHPGRCIQVAKPFMSPGDLREIAPIEGMFDNTVASVVMEHSTSVFRFSFMATGLPDVGAFASKMIAQHRRQAGLERELSTSMRHRDWDGALETMGAMRAQQPDDSGLLWKEFNVLATGKQDRDAAFACGEKLLKQLLDNPHMLNNYAWELLTEDAYGGSYDELALRMAARSNELSHQLNWAYVDTLALALFKTGNVEAAVEMERHALELCGDSPQRKEVAATLKRFASALGEAKGGEVGPG